MREERGALLRRNEPLLIQQSQGFNSSSSSRITHMEYDPGHFFSNRGVKVERESMSVEEFSLKSGDKGGLERTED